MSNTFYDRFILKADEVKGKLSEKHPESYLDLVKMTFQAIAEADPKAVDRPDHQDVVSISTGNYDGTHLFVTPGVGYCSDEFFYVKIGYGSCSGCDTLEGIRGYSNGTPSKTEVEEYFELARNIALDIRKI